MNGLNRSKIYGDVLYIAILSIYSFVQIQGYGGLRMAKTLEDRWA